MAEHVKSKLFKNVSQKLYDHYFNQLQVLRHQYPQYRDDELLMYMLCYSHTKENKL